MKPIIDPVDKELLKAELTKKHFVRTTNKAGNEIYDITAHEAPNLMREIARLRELSFREAGGSTGEEMDIDEVDTMAPHPYHQLIVWDPDAEEIVGGYRYLHCKKCQFLENGQPHIPSAHMFRYTDYFIKHYLPYTLELGRAFVQPKYQSKEMGLKALFALDNLWDGLGAIFYKNPDVRYLIGKVTIYPSYDVVSRDLIYAFMRRYCNDDKGLFFPIKPVEIGLEAQEIADEIFEGKDMQSNFKFLQKAVRARGTTVPSMFTAYINLTDTIKYFGNAVNDEMSDVIETGIMVTIDDIHKDKKLRYIGTYIQSLRKQNRRNRFWNLFSKSNEEQEN